MLDQPKVTIIVPCYNAELYLRQCLKNIVRQDINFRKNMELVLINDGSTDGTDEICVEYAEHFPNNVIYHCQLNAGVSAARNKGIELASGEIIGFVDADDVLSVDASLAVYRYFQITRDLVDVAVVRVENFGARRGPHYANGKFHRGMATLDLSDPRWFDVCTRVGQAFFRAEALQNIRFDTSVTYFEDTKFINEVLASKMLLGVVDKGIYYYRRYSGENDANTSLTVGATTNKQLYLETPQKVSLYLLKHNDNIDGVPEYFQYVALTEMRWRTFYNPVQVYKFLDAEEYESYQKIDREILSMISDKVITSDFLYNFWQRVYLLDKKYQKNILSDAVIDEDLNLTWQDHVLFNICRDLTVNITDILVEDQTLYIEGYFLGFLEGDLEVYAKTGSSILKTEIEKYSLDATSYPIEGKYYKHSKFRTELSLIEPTVQIQFAYKIRDVEGIIRRISISVLGNVDHVRPVVQIRDGWIIYRQNDKISIYKNTLKNRRYIRYITKRPGDQFFAKIKRRVKSLLSKIKRRLKRILKGK